MRRNPTPRAFDMPPVAELERSLDLRAEDREELQGLFALNTRRVPRVRLLGFQLLSAFAVLHNVAVLGDPLWGRLLPVIVGVEAYAVLQLFVLRRFFARSKRVHLGLVFLVADLAAFTAVVWATGGPSSLLWPIYLVRVGDQMWTGRRRAAAFGALGVLAYLGLIAGMAGLGGAEIAWGAEALKISALAAMAGFLVYASSVPWDLQGKAHAAKDVIIRLEEQSLELDAERQRAEYASRAKSQFLERMSHELRTPLNSVVGFTNILLKQHHRFEDRELDFLQRIRRNGVHLLALINDILDYARIEEGRLDVTPADIDLGAVVRDTIRQLEGTRGASRVRVSFGMPALMSDLHADETRVRQILVNLIGNALKFTQEGWVRVEVDADSEGRPVALHVHDTGIGIPPDRIAHIFDPFEQSEGDTRRKFGGTGLGLAISHSLCRLMEFELLARSEPGKGSTFTVRFRPEERVGV